MGNNPTQSFDEAFESWVGKLEKDDLVKLSELFYIEDKLDDEQSELDERRKLLSNIYKALEQGMRDKIHQKLVKPELSGVPLKDAGLEEDNQLEEAKLKVIVKEAEAAAAEEAVEAAEEEGTVAGEGIKESAKALVTAEEELKDCDV